MFRVIHLVWVFLIFYYYWKQITAQAIIWKYRLWENKNSNNTIIQDMIRFFDALLWEGIWPLWICLLELILKVSFKIVRSIFFCIFFMSKNISYLASEVTISLWINYTYLQLQKYWIAPEGPGFAQLLSGFEHACLV